MHIPYNLFENPSELLEYYDGTTPPSQLIMEKKEDRPEKKKNCIFRDIIVFTNSKSDSNKTLNNIKESLLEFENPPSLHVFVAAKCDYDEKLTSLVIRDDDEELEVKNQSNLDTLVFSRLGVWGESECEHVVKLLQDRGFLVLNPIRNSALASNKYETATFLKKCGISQPKYCLITKEILSDHELFVSNMREIYENFSEDSNKNKDLDVVVKILDGHGGTGVFLTNCKRLLAILQAIFAIDPERQLLIQEKLEADGGDLRIHVLTLRSKQIVLGSMKRLQLKGDFRSNVSLGADVVRVKLTEEQEKLAKNVALLSGLPWCAVDIMHTKDGKDYVLEVNASPGTLGVSELLGENIITKIISELDNPSDFVLQDKVAGYIESATIDFGGGINKTYLAKLDTGNNATACTLEVGDFSIENGKVCFMVDGKKMEFEHKDNMTIYAGDSSFSRPVIVVPMLTCGQRKVSNVRIACVKTRNHKSTNLLLNLSTLGTLGYVVSSSKTHILTNEMEKVKII